MKTLLIIICFLGSFMSNGQELVGYRRNDVFAVESESKYLISTLRIGYNYNLQQRNSYFGGNILFAHLDTDFYVFKGDSTAFFAGFNVGHEFTYLEGFVDSIPRFSNKIYATGYLDLDGGYKIGLSHYAYNGKSQFEASIELVYNFSDFASGGLIYARNFTQKSDYFQLAYRIPIPIGSERNNFKLGAGFSGYSLLNIDNKTIYKFGKIKAEIFYERFIKLYLPSIVTVGSVSYDAVLKSLQFDIGLHVSTDLFRILWLPKKNDDETM